MGPNRLANGPIDHPMAQTSQIGLSEFKIKIAYQYKWKGYVVNWSSYPLDSRHDTPLNGGTIDTKLKVHTSNYK